MTPQERDLLTNLVSRLRQSPSQQTDPEAERMINDLVDEKPDTPYVLAQTVLIQDYALHQAQDRIADLEQQLKGQPARKSGGFLSAIFGGGGDPPPQRPPQYQQQQAYQQQTYQQPAYAPPPAYAQPGPWGGGSGQPSFLRSAATTAAGIAGGALLFQGIESLFHPGFGGGFGGGGFGGGFGGAGFMPQPGITETVVNNYYDNPSPGSDNFSQGGSTDTAFDRGGDLDSGSDSGFRDSSFDDGGSSDFGGGGDDFV